MAIATMIPDKRVPFFYVALDPSQAGGGADRPKTLVLGQKLAAGTAITDVPYWVTSLADGGGLVGYGSQAYEAIAAALLNDPDAELWIIVQSDANGATNATGTVTFTAAATANGTLWFGVGHRTLQVGVKKDDAVGTMATALAAAINADGTLPVTAAAVGGVVTLTCRWKGTTGNQIKLAFNPEGTRGGQVLPAGVAATIVAMAGGATDPTLTAARSAMADMEYDYIISCYADTTNVPDLEAEMELRWGYASQLYGHFWIAKRDTVGNLSTFGNARNSPFATCAGYEQANMTSPWVYAAAYGATVSGSLRVSPARPAQFLALKGVATTPAGSRFTATERETLLYDGIATSCVIAGKTCVEHEITMYQTNQAGAPDEAYLEVQTPERLKRINRDFRAHITTKYPRCGLIDDTDGEPPEYTVTPSTIAAEAIVKYQDWMELGWVEDLETFQANLAAERSKTNRNRVGMLLPPNLSGQFRQFAMVNQFRR